MGEDFYSCGMARIGGKRPRKLYVREWIEHLGLNQKQVAERMDETEAQISRLLSGKRRMTIEYLHGFADALNRENINDLYRDPSAPTREELLGPLDDSQFKEVVDFADFIRNRRAS